MKKSRLFSVVLIIVLLLGMAPLALAQTETTEQTRKTVYYAAPAIFAESGKEIDLSRYDVMFDAVSVTSAEQITWSSAALDITENTVTPVQNVLKNRAAIV